MCGTGGPVKRGVRTPARSVRISPALWAAARAKADARGETVTDVVRRALERYVKSGPTGP